MQRQRNIFEGTGSSSRFLTDKDIRLAVTELGMITYWEEDCLAPNSYDMRVGRKAVVGGTKKIINLEEENVLTLQPGNYGLIISFERLKLPKSVFVRIGPKKRFAYEGLILLSGSVVDPGYEGHLLLGYYNASQRDLPIRYQSKICNLVFTHFEGNTERTVTPDPMLLKGDIPDLYVEQMFNTTVWSWSELSKRVDKIQDLTTDIIDLKQKYKDVHEPIRTLTSDVDKLREGIKDLKVIVDENARGIQGLTSTVNTLANLEQSFESEIRSQREHLDEARVKIKTFSTIVYIIGSIFILSLGGLITYLITVITK